MKKLFLLFLLIPLLISAQDMLLNGMKITVTSAGEVHANTLDVDTMWLRTKPARISAHITDSGQTTTSSAGVYYFMKGTFHNDNTQSFGFTGDTLQYQNGDYKYLVGAYSFTVGSSVNLTEVVTAIYRNDEIIDGSNGYFISRSQTPIGKVTGCFMFRVMNNDKIKIMVKSDKAGAVITTYNGSTWLHEIY